MKKYLIIGGAGFIGSHLSKALLVEGNKVVIIDNSSIKTSDFNIERYSIDTEDAKKVAAVFAKEKPNIVFHLAGPIHLRKPINDPAFLKAQNFLSRTKIILDACKKSQVKKIIYVSSGGAIYQDANKIPTSETYLAHPESLYGLANLAIEKYITLYDKNYGLPFTIARLSNAYGPGQWESGFVPAMILRIVKNESPIINGNGNQTRDFIYIDDVIEALLLLAKKGKNEIYNVGSGQGVSLNQVFAQIKGLLGVKIRPTYKKAGGQETQKSAMDIKKIKTKLGWAPAINLKIGLKKTLAYYGRK